MSTRVSLGVLLALIAGAALGGGLYGLAGADGIPVAWLAGTPFHSYLVPSAILIVAVGGSCAFAAIEVLGRRRDARLAARVAGAITLGWIAVQVAILGYVSWLQPAVAIAGVAMLLLSKRGTSVPRLPDDRLARRGTPVSPVRDEIVSRSLSAGADRAAVRRR